MKLRRPIRFLEFQPHRKFVGLPATRAAAAGNSHDRVDMKLVLHIIRIEKFHGDGPFGFLIVLIFPFGMRVDAVAWTKPMVHVHDQRYRWNRLEVLLGLYSDRH